MSSPFDFEYRAAETTARVRRWHKQKLGAWIYGPIGTGKSHAVRAADLRGVAVSVVPGPLLGQRFASDLARQLGPDGRALLGAVKRKGFAAALEIAEEAINGHALVVDSAEQLLVEPVNLDEPATALWQEDKNALRDWLMGRLERSPTFLISQWNPGSGTRRHRHRVSEHWTVERPESFHGSLDRLAKVAGHPGALVLARALATLIPADAFDALLAEADEDEVEVTSLFQRLGRAFQSSTPRSWQRVLALLAALGEAPRDAVEPVLGGGRGMEATSEPAPGELLAALHRLQQLELIEEQGGRLSVLPVLSAFGVRPLTDQERTEILPAVAHQLLAPVNEVRSLEPGHAGRVLLAHSIFVALGDLGNAERTAVLHVHGLVDLARRTSLNERFSNACQQYDSVLRMLRSSDFAVEDRAGRRLLSYVRHYYAWNGFRAGTLDDAVCLDEYERAVEEWPENALWHQRAIQTLVRLGRLLEVRRAVERGERWVESHPRKYELLRVRPARTALDVGALQLSLELIEPIVDVSTDELPEVADGCDALLRRWKHGFSARSLMFLRGGASAEGRVTLLQPAEVRVHRSTSDWIAELPGLWTEASAESPGKALEALARNLGEEVRRLVSTITPDLSDKEIRRKGELLSYVDALNSNIGLHHDPDRWIVGRIEERQLIPTMRRLPPVEIPPELMPETTEGLFFVRVPVYRDGFPSGPAEVIKPAGRGSGYGDLVELLERMNGDVA